MNAAPAVALPFSSHARLSGAPPRPARPALRLAHPGDTPGARRDEPAVPAGQRAVPGDVPARGPSRPQPSRQPHPQARPAPHPQARPAPHPQAHPRTERSPLRLTRRGRFVVGALAVLIVSAFCLIAASTALATNHGAPAGGTRGGTTKVTVQPGQSLWSVAESADPDQDTRLVVQQITGLNGLASQVVHAGEQLWVPRG